MHPIPDRVLRRRLQVGQLLRAERRHQNLTQDQLAERAGLDSKTVSRIENGVMSPILDHLLDLADALDVPPASLLPDDPSAS